MPNKEEILKQLVTDLGWDYDRMSDSGQVTYNNLCLLLGISLDVEVDTDA